MSDFKRSINFNCVSAITIALFSILSLLILSVENGRAAPISAVITSKSGQVSERKDSKPNIIAFRILSRAALWAKLEQEATLLRRCRITGSLTTVASEKLLKFDGRKWPSHILWFKISKYPSLLNEHNDREHVIAEIERSFRIWEDVTNLTFIRRNTGEVDIEIRFEQGYHDDLVKRTQRLMDRDGTAREIRYSQIDFDYEEDWSIKSIFYVAGNIIFILYEIGHALGLDHSRVSGTVMWYAYTGNQANFKLHWDEF
ncbi:Stromelysin-2, partial [Orchesella cincta]